MASSAIKSGDLPRFPSAHCSLSDGECGHNITIVSVEIIEDCHIEDSLRDDDSGSGQPIHQKFCSLEVNDDVLPG